MPKPVFVSVTPVTPHDTGEVMTYSPGNPPGGGFPPAQPPGSYSSGSYTAPTQSFAPATEPGPKLPLYLSAAVVVLGLAAYLSSFGPVFTSSAELGPISVEATSGGGPFLTLATLLAALLAAVGLVPKVKGHLAVVAILATLGVLVVIGQLFNTSSYVTTGWAAWLVLAFSVLQAIVAIAALLIEAGVISAPTPRPKYEQPQYGQYGPPSGYYGQPQGQPQQQGPQQQGPRPGYPTQYGAYTPGPTSGYVPQESQDNSPPTPPTGYPSFSPPPAVGSGQHTAPQPQPPQTQQSAPSPGPTPS
ncbi:34 kDa antigenic protein [Mycolicibacterium murale]|uniref:34 kDa antigenic protein n=2 Tax=Mycolicibacterium murale TaxID=182220 RepID=A0A7I9WW02_9MYCO|nr:34 kDa antigenic protein [Mycolicibacterium murale]